MGADLHQGARVELIEIFQFQTDRILQPRENQRATPKDNRMHGSNGLA
jgi:hypothetical protein